MSSSGELVQRRGQQQGQGVGPQGAAAHGSAAAGAGPLKTWHMWMLFGLGWPSVLLFFLSTIPSFGPKVEGYLITFGWLFCSSWWISTVSGLLTDNMGKKQQVAFKANAIMAGIGSVIGGVFLVSYAYYNWPWLYIAGIALAAGAVFVVRSLDEGSKAADTGAGGATAPGPGAADPAAGSGDHQE